MELPIGQLATDLITELNAQKKLIDGAIEGVKLLANKIQKHAEDEAAKAVGDELGK